MSSEVELIEASLARLGARIPEVPLDELLILRLILRLSQDFGRLLEQRTRPFGLGEAEFRVLTVLFAQPEGIAHPSELCPRASQSPGNMSRISDALVRHGLISRGPCESDRRRMVLRITEQGEVLVRRILPQMFERLRTLCGGQSREEKQTLIDLLTRLAAPLDDMLSPGSTGAAG